MSRFSLFPSFVGRGDFKRFCSVLEIEGTVLFIHPLLAAARVMKQFCYQQMRSQRGILVRGIQSGLC